MEELYNTHVFFKKILFVYEQLYYIHIIYVLELKLML